MALAFPGWGLRSATWLTGALGLSLLTTQAHANQEVFTYSFENVGVTAVPPDAKEKAGEGTITGKFDYNSTTGEIINFSTVQVSLWNNTLNDTPLFATYDGTTSVAGDLLFTGSSGKAATTDPEFLLISGITLTNHPGPAFDLTDLNDPYTGSVIRYCVIPGAGCPGSQFQNRPLTFNSGLILGVPFPLTPLSITPFALAIARARKRYKGTRLDPEFQPKLPTFDPVPQGLLDVVPHRLGRAASPPLTCAGTAPDSLPPAPPPPL